MLALYAVAATIGRNAILLTLQVTVDAVIVNRRLAAIFDKLQIAACLVIADQQAAIVGLEMEIPVDSNIAHGDGGAPFDADAALHLGRGWGADATALVAVIIAIIIAIIVVYCHRRCPFGLNIAIHQNVACDQGCAIGNLEVATHLCAGQRTRGIGGYAEVIDRYSPQRALTDLITGAAGRRERDIERCALLFLVALHCVVAAGGRRCIFLALQVAVNAIIGNGSATAILEDLQVAANLVIRGDEYTTVGLKLDVANHRHIGQGCATTLLKLDAAADCGVAGDIDDGSAFGLQITIDPNGGGIERSPVLDFEVPLDACAVERTGGAGRHFQILNRHRA